MDKMNRTVDHKTRVILKLVDEPIPYDIVKKANPLEPETVRSFGDKLQYRAYRVAAMMEALATQGFTFYHEKDCIYADSDKVEAQEVKHFLIDKGFHDREFQVWLEYIRKWGMM